MKSFATRKRLRKVQKGGWPWTTRKNATKYLSTRKNATKYLTTRKNATKYLSTPTGSGFVYPTASATASLRFEKEDVDKFIAAIIFKIKSKLPSAEAEPFGKILSYPLTEVLYDRLQESTRQQQFAIEDQLSRMPNLIKVITSLIRLWKYAQMTISSNIAKQSSPIPSSVFLETSTENTASKIATVLIGGWVDTLRAELAELLEWIRSNEDRSLYTLLFAEFKELDKLYVSNYLMSCSTELDAKIEAIKTANNPLLKSLKDYLAYEPGSTFSFSRKTRSKRTCPDRLPVSNGPVMSNSANASTSSNSASAVTPYTASASPISNTPNASAISSTSASAVTSYTPSASTIPLNSASPEADTSSASPTSYTPNASAISSTSASREAAIASNSLSTTTRTREEEAAAARAAAREANERLFDTIVQQTDLVARIDRFVKLFFPIMMLYIANNPLTLTDMKTHIPLILTKLHPGLAIDFIAFVIRLIPSDLASIQQYINSYNEEKNITEDKIELLHRTVLVILSGILNNFITLIMSEGPNLSKEELKRQVETHFGIPPSLLINFFGLIARQLQMYNIGELSYLNEPEHIADITNVVTIVIGCFTPPKKLCPPGWSKFSLQTPTQIMDSVVYAILLNFLGTVTGTLAKGVFNRFTGTRTAIISGLTTFLANPAYNRVYISACTESFNPGLEEIRMFAVNMLFVVIRSVQSIPEESWSGINGLIKKVKPEFQGIAEALKRLEWTLYYTYNFPPWYFERSAVYGGRRRRTRRTKK